MKTDKIAIKTYDYTGCDPEVKAKLINLSGHIIRKSKISLQAMLEMGEAISEAQELLSKHKTGSFGKWIELECGFGRQTAHNYMNAWKRFGHLSNLLGQYSFDAIYLLAAPQAPPEAATKAEIFANKGVRITGKVARGLLAPPAKHENGKPTAEAAKPPEPPKPPAAEPAAKAAEKPTAKISPDFIAASDIEAGEVVYTDLSPAKPETFELSAEETDADILDFNPAKLEAAPAATVNIKTLASPYKLAVLEINSIVRTFQGLASVERTGVHLADKITRITHDLTEAREAISQSEPVQPCGKCNGAGCKSCFQSGFWTRAIVGSRKR